MLSRRLRTRSRRAITGYNMATAPLPTPATNPTPALIVAVPSDPASAAAFAAGNLFVFLCTPAGQNVAGDAAAAGKAIGDVGEGLAPESRRLLPRPPSVPPGSTALLPGPGPRPATPASAARPSVPGAP